MKEEDVFSRDPKVVSGELLFTNTRVPVKNLMDYLQAGHYSVEQFLDDFPGVSREQAIGYLEMAREAVEDRTRAGSVR